MTLHYSFWKREDAERRIRKLERQVISKITCGEIVIIRPSADERDMYTKSACENTVDRHRNQCTHKFVHTLKILRNYHNSKNEKG